MSNRHRAVLACALAFVAACGSEGPGGSKDAGAKDGGTDAGAKDSGTAAGGCDAGTCSVRSCGFHDGLDANERLMIFAGPDGRELLIVRAVVGPGVGESVLFELRAFALLDPLGLRCQSDGLSYVNSHHNWRDQAIATGNDGLTRGLAISFEPAGSDPVSQWEWHFTLEIERDHVPVGDPIRFQLVEGTPWP